MKQHEKNMKKTQAKIQDPTKKTHVLFIVSKTTYVFFRFIGKIKNACISFQKTAKIQNRLSLVIVNYFLVPKRLGKFYLCLKNFPCCGSPFPRVRILRSLTRPCLCIRVHSGSNSSRVELGS